MPNKENSSIENSVSIITIDETKVYTESKKLLVLPGFMFLLESF